MDDTLYMPLDQQSITNEASKRRSLLITSTTLALLLVLSVFWHPSALPPLQSCSSVSTSPSAPPPLLPIHNSNLTTKRTFHATKIYSDLSAAADDEWTQLIPPNGGFVLVENANNVEQHSGNGNGDGKGKEGDKHAAFAGVSMFHQLHCLAMIREAVQDMRAGRQPVLESDDDAPISKDVKHGDDDESNDDGTTGNGGRRRLQIPRRRNDAASASASASASSSSADMHKHKKPSTTTKEEHWVHCLDYLVQAVLCSADDTIEPAYRTRDGGLVVDGYGIEHQCRDPSRIWTQVMGKESRPAWEVAEAMVSGAKDETRNESGIS